MRLAAKIDIFYFLTVLLLTTTNTQKGSTPFLLLKMPRFLHVSPKGETITKDNFKRPKTIKPAHETSTFNARGALYLSKVDDDNPESSMWLRYRTMRMENEKLINSHGADDSPDCWLSPDAVKTVIDIDFHAQKIYVVDTPDDLKTLFLKYGIFEQKAVWEPGTDGDIYHRDNLRVQRMQELPIIIEFLDTKIHDPKHIEALSNPDKLAKLIETRTIRNMPLVKIKAGQVVIPKKGITTEFLVDLIRTRISFEKLIDDPQDLQVATSIKTLDYNRMLADGYNGLYYSTNLVRFNDKVHDGIELDRKSRPRFVNWQGYIARPDIGDIPDFMPFLTDQYKGYIKDEIEDYIDWLGSDTLILWNWV